jgi:hypothetical protein
MWARASILAVLAALAVVVSGCLSVTASVYQPQSLGPLRLTVNGCAAGSPGCPAAGNGTSIYGFMDDTTPLTPIQVLVAIRLPVGATPPPAFVATMGDGDALAFARSTSFESELQQLEPAPSGEIWWGWISREVMYNRRTTQSFSFTVEVPLPRPPDGSALPSPLHWRPVVGARFAQPGGGHFASRSVDCGATREQLYGGITETGSGMPTVTCVTSPSAEATRGFIDAPFTDFGLEGDSVELSAGGVTTATFFAQRTGAPDPSTTFALAASGGAPGGSVTLNRTTFSLDEDDRESVSARIAVPPATAPGSYPVTLTATAPGKPTRTAVATVVVPASGPAVSGPGTAGGVAPVGRPDVAPVLSASLKPARFRAGARARRALRTRGRRAAVGTTVRVSLSEPASLAVSVERPTQARRAKGRCSARARRGARCTLVTHVGRLPPRSLPAGTSSFTFTGKLGRKTLAPGRYTLTLVKR